MTLKSRLIEELKLTIEGLGFEPGTEEFNMKLRELKIEHCLSFRSLFSCEECEMLEFCTLIEEYVVGRRDI